VTPAPLRRRNTPSGWRAFCALRCAPVPIPPRRHGNWKHGAYAKADIEAFRRVRALIQALRRGAWGVVPLPRRVRRPVLGRPKPCA
jgi:hypothetical protein